MPQDHFGIISPEKYTRSNCSNTWKRVTKASFCYFVKLLISSTKLLATGNLARDGLIKWWTSRCVELDHCGADLVHSTYIVPWRIGVEMMDLREMMVSKQKKHVHADKLDESCEKV
ncbi:uncharacterized protein [Dysidea avara]|uniref:uncharacterized protein n=1 Tax=Dysidea avara TaxID=196820 RepID=UPI0033203BF9